MEMILEPPVNSMLFFLAEIQTVYRLFTNSNKECQPVIVYRVRICEDENAVNRRNWI